MITFLIVVGIILWVSLIVASLIGTFAFTNEGWQPIVVCAVVCVLLTAGLITLGINNGIFADAIPPDGCYRVTRDTDYIPMQSGKAIVPVPVEDANFIPTECNG